MPDPLVPKSAPLRTFTLRAGYDGAQHAWFVTEASAPAEPFEDVHVIEAKVTDEMVEQAARALCNHANRVEADTARENPDYRAVFQGYEEWCDEWGAQARAALEAALSTEQL